MVRIFRVEALCRTTWTNKGVGADVLQRGPLLYCRLLIGISIEACSFYVVLPLFHFLFFISILHTVVLHMDTLRMSTGLAQINRSYLQSKCGSRACADSGTVGRKGTYTVLSAQYACTGPG